MSPYVPYSNQPRYRSTRRYLRLHATKAEKTLWKHLRNGQLGIKFRRQYSIGSYIVDFFCYELSLIIEIDGGIHGEKEVILKDKKRDAWLRTQGYRIVRYTNEQVVENTEGVYIDLKMRIDEMLGVK